MTYIIHVFDIFIMYYVLCIIELTVYTYDLYNPCIWYFYHVLCIIYNRIESLHLHIVSMAFGAGLVSYVSVLVLLLQRTVNYSRYSVSFFLTWNAFFDGLQCKVVSNVKVFYIMYQSVCVCLCLRSGGVFLLLRKDTRPGAMGAEPPLLFRTRHCEHVTLYFVVLHYAWVSENKVR